MCPQRGLGWHTPRQNLVYKSNLSSWCAEYIVHSALQGWVLWSGPPTLLGGLDLDLDPGDAEPCGGLTALDGNRCRLQTQHVAMELGDIDAVPDPDPGVPAAQVSLPQLDVRVTQLQDAHTVDAVEENIQLHLYVTVNGIVSAEGQ